MSTDASSDTTTPPANNPLLADWSARPFAMAPFPEIQTEHFEPALHAAMAAHLADLQAIVDDPATPDFANVVAAYDRAGRVLDRVAGVYSNLGSSLNTEALQAVQTKMSPLLSRHRSKAFTLPGLFAKIDAVHQGRHKANLTAEQVRLVERIHMDVSRKVWYCVQQKGTSPAQ